MPPRERPPARPILATEDDLHGETVQVLTQTRQWSLGVLLGEQDIAGAKQYRVHVLGTPDQVVVDEGKILFLPDQPAPAPAPEWHTVARYRPVPQHAAAVMYRGRRCASLKVFGE